MNIVLSALVMIIVICTGPATYGKNRKARPARGIGSIGGWLPRGPIFPMGCPDDGLFPPWYNSGPTFGGDDDGEWFGGGSTGDLFGDGNADPFRRRGDGFGWGSNGHWKPGDSAYGCPSGDCVQASMTAGCWYNCKCSGSYDQRSGARDGVTQLQGKCTYWV